MRGSTATSSAAEPSSRPPMSLLGLVRHMIEVERGWFRGAAECKPDGAFDDITDADPEAAFAAFRAEVAQAGAAVADPAQQARGSVARTHPWGHRHLATTRPGRGAASSTTPPPT
ncbi:DUF664 domain-containing protein [Nocardia niwae]|uniref:DUF664 domain-containing protein n=1 Tax=Nocardia niwae TaxID=626084 RepID=A0ABV2XDJ2_9NOCA|nr:DUF664 domain-containing protein [Nocardia niwae]